MAADKPVVIVTRKIAPDSEARLQDMFGARLNAADKQFTRAELFQALGEADAVVVFVTDRLDAEALSHAGPRLKLIANFGVGVDHIDLKAAATRGIAVSNTPGVLTDDTADLTMALIMAAPRRLSEGERLIRAGQWSGWEPMAMVGHRVSGKRLAIIGMGRIGQAVARRAHGGFGMAIHYHNRSRLAPDREAQLQATYWSDLDAMLAQADIVSINCPSTPATRHLLSAERLGRLRRHVYIVNTARGDIIDEAALADMLEQGRIAGAGLDVYEREPLIEPRLLDLDNVVLLPHMGSATYEGRIGMGDKVIANVKACLAGEPLPDRVPAPAS
ncbi:MAG: D-glycerate dehydrogenase [Alphaproteobacteria bacterium]|nr:D-glycerate dehydrogenase [Alphaproteobacteria bacterium]